MTKPEPNLVVDDDGDQLDARDRCALHRSIERSLNESEEGRTAPADEILDKLRARRRG